MTENSTDSSRQRVREIFFEVYRRKTPDERSQYLGRVCGDEPELRREVESLLEAYGKSGSLLEDSPLACDIGVDDSPISEGPGTVIGRYKLLERIGEGGMAVVYMAEQAQPIRRKVALKIIKLGMDTKQVIARFEAERQALAMMDHPNIAKVLDAGATETGRPYFVMELVQGVSITEYCDRNELNTKERLALFVQVCNAVQHAHQKGIIHRDIKPSNVMVTSRDGTAVPKIIDFGIAKATSQKLTEKTLFTRYAHIIGTPAYMSPEQAELSELDVDTRTDIYSLGVLLYELLTGTQPFSEEELRKSGYLEMQRVIREEEPARPSTKLSTLGAALTDVAKYRGATPDLLRRTISGDLDWIVMKSLEKDRTRRYETANNLADDIRRHLANEPVLAGAPTTMYRLNKLLRRRRSEVLAGLTLLVVLIAVGAIVSRWNRDRRQLVEAESFRHQSILSEAREQHAKAQREAALETLAPILQSRHVGPEAQLLKAGILIDIRRSEEAWAMLGNLLNDRVEIAGMAHSLLARILLESESPDAAKQKDIDEHLRQAEALLPENAEAYFLRAMTAVTVKEQLASLDKALQLDRRHYESLRLRAFTYYASRNYELMRDDALGMTFLREGDPLGYSLRAVASKELGRHQEAIVDYERAIELTPNDSNECIDLSAQRIEVLLRMGDYGRAIVDAQEYLRLSPDSSILRFRLFCALTALGEYELATALFRQIISGGHDARSQFRKWCVKHVFDTVAAGGVWHPSDREPAGAAFLSILEAEETYRKLSAKGRRLTTDGFSADWSPDGKKLAFSLGVQGYSGVAVYDPATQETELLIVPGKDPRWSPDGKYIAFVRDRQNLRLEELASGGREKDQLAVTDEEIWFMTSDGTDPRRLAQGSWPSWGRDCQHLYYLSRENKKLCSITLAGEDAEAKQIIKCSKLPSVSPDNRLVSYFDGESLKIKDLASQQTVAECAVPFMTWGVTGWSGRGNEVFLSGGNPLRDTTGLWLYDLQGREFLGVLDGRITSAAWSPAATELAFCLGSPYSEIWVTDLDPGMPAVEAIGPGVTVNEHLNDMVAFYTRRIEADPQNAYAYSGRAQYLDYLGDRTSARADMKRWSAIAGGGQASDVKSLERAPSSVLALPFDCEFVFSAERPVNTNSMMSIAFRQKGRCEMKLFKIPMLAASVFGLSVLLGLHEPAAQADIMFGEPVDPASIIAALDPVDDCVGLPSYDGLEMYIESYRSEGFGDADIWVLRRDSTDEEWGPAENLGPTINTSRIDAYPCLSKDGLTLYFNSVGRPDGYGSSDIYMTTRAAKGSPWGEPVNLGPIVNSVSIDAGGFVSADGLELYFFSSRPGGYGETDIYVTRRLTVDDPWGEPENLGPQVNSPYDDANPGLSPNGLVLFFSDWRYQSAPRPGGYGGTDIWMTRRASISAPWQEAVNIGPPINTSNHEMGAGVWWDGSTLIYISKIGNSWYNWQAPIIPKVDFNSDGNVDNLDLGLLMIGWGTDNSLYDIGPTPLGDGIVDSKDLMVLAEHGAMLCGDVNWDGVVDLLDLAELSKNWLQNGNQ